MISAVTLIFSPAQEWERIANANRGAWWVLLACVVPCFLIGFGIEYYGMVTWGDRRAGFETAFSIPVEVAQRYVATHAVLGLALLFLGSYFVHTTARSFDVQSTYSQAFTTVGYALGPIFLLHALDAIPGLITWVPWAIGASLATRVLYHGVALCLRPEQTKGFGLFIFAMVCVVGLSALVQFAGWMVLEGRYWQ